MRDMVFNRIDVEMLSAAQAQASDYNSQVAAIADLWQFWVDPAMVITVILPPGDTDFAHFPLGEHTLGCVLFEAIGIDAAESNAIDFNRRFETRRKILNAKFISKNDNGTESALIVSGMPLWNEDGDFEGYRCTVADMTHAIANPTSSAEVPFQRSRIR